MNIWDIVACVFLAAAIFLAVRSVIKQKKKGGCCGDCIQCGSCNKAVDKK